MGWRNEARHGRCVGYENRVIGWWLKRWQDERRWREIVCAKRVNNARCCVEQKSRVGGRNNNAMARLSGAVSLTYQFRPLLRSDWLGSARDKWVTNVLLFHFHMPPSMSFGALYLPQNSSFMILENSGSFWKGGLKSKLPSPFAKGVPNPSAPGVPPFMLP